MLQAVECIVNIGSHHISPVQHKPHHTELFRDIGHCWQCIRLMELFIIFIVDKNITDPNLSLCHQNKYICSVTIYLRFFYHWCRGWGCLTLYLLCLLSLMSFLILLSWQRLTEVSVRSVGGGQEGLSPIHNKHNWLLNVPGLGPSQRQPPLWQPQPPAELWAPGCNWGRSRLPGRAFTLGTADQVKKGWKINRYCVLWN